MTRLTAPILLTMSMTLVSCSASHDCELARHVELACESFAADLSLAADALRDGKEPMSAYDLSLDARRRGSGLTPMFHFCLRTRRVDPKTEAELSRRFDELGQPLRETHDRAVAAQTLAEIAAVAREVAELPPKK